MPSYVVHSSPHNLTAVSLFATLFEPPPATRCRTSPGVLNNICALRLYSSSRAWAPPLHLKGFPAFPLDPPPPPSSSIPTPPSITCALGHSCPPHTYDHGRHSCNICRNSISAGSSGARCSTCDFDVCGVCLAKSVASCADDGAKVAQEAMVHHNRQSLSPLLCSNTRSHRIWPHQSSNTVSFTFSRIRCMRANASKRFALRCRRTTQASPSAKNH